MRVNIFKYRSILLGVSCGLSLLLSSTIGFGQETIRSEGGVIILEKSDDSTIRHKSVPTRERITIPRNPLPRVGIPREPLPRNPVPRNVLPRNPIEKKPLPRVGIPRNPLPRDPVPRNQLPRNPVPRNPLPRNPIPSD